MNSYIRSVPSDLIDIIVTKLSIYDVDSMVILDQEYATKKNWNKFIKDRYPSAFDYLLKQLKLFGDKDTSDIPYDVWRFILNLEWVRSSFDITISLPELYIKEKISVSASRHKNIVMDRSISTLVNIKNLEMPGVNLSYIPSEIGKLSNLTSLDLSNNKITLLPNSIGNMKNLTDLKLGGNILKHLPLTVTNFQLLKKLDIGGNKMGSLPDSIGNLTSLTRLDIYSNEISNIPESISKMVNLIFLYAHDNLIKDLPDVFSRLTSLERIGLQNNKLCEMPKAITMLKSIQSVSIDNNPMRYSKTIQGEEFTLVKNDSVYLRLSRTYRQSSDISREHEFQSRVDPNETDRMAEFLFDVPAMSEDSDDDIMKTVD